LYRANAVDIPGNYFHAMIPSDAFEFVCSIAKMLYGAIVTFCILANQTFSD
jgi:hypothetical protein